MVDASLEFFHGIEAGVEVKLRDIDGVVPDFYVLRAFRRIAEKNLVQLSGLGIQDLIPVKKTCSLGIVFDLFSPLLNSVVGARAAFEISEGLEFFIGTDYCGTVDSQFFSQASGGWERLVDTNCALIDKFFDPIDELLVERLGAESVDFEQHDLLRLSSSSSNIILKLVSVNIQLLIY